VPKISTEHSLGITAAGCYVIICANIFLQFRFNKRNTETEYQRLFRDPLKVLHLTEVSHRDRAVRLLEDVVQLL
jgi:hypothetical protein